VPLTVEGHPRTLSGPSLDPSFTTAFAPSAPGTLMARRVNRISSSGRGRPDRFRLDQTSLTGLRWTALHDSKLQPKLQPWLRPVDLRIMSLSRCVARGFRASTTFSMADMGVADVLPSL
jgi:hypothetical protein